MRYIFDALFAIAVLGLIFSLVKNVRQFLTLRDLEEDIQQLQTRLVGQGGKLNEAVESCIRTFTSELESYRGALGDQAAMDAVALRNLGQDLPVLSKIVGYAVASGWPQALYVLAGIRPRLILGQFVLSRSTAVPPEVEAGIEPLLRRMRSFSGLQGMYYDFYQGHIMAVKPSREQERQWPDRQLAELTAADTEEEAKQLMAVLGNRQ